MKILFKMLLAGVVLTTSAYADIPYCSGIKVDGSKHVALQKLVKEFAAKNGCEIGNNCISNYDKIKYSIAWSKNCNASAHLGDLNDGSTFVCNFGTCRPYGYFFNAVSESYTESFLGEN